MSVSGAPKTTRIARNGFRAIAESLRQRIESGDFEFGGFLPTERELQEEFQASRATIRKALAAVVDSGWARTVPNKGVMAGRGFRTGHSSQIALIDGGTDVMRRLAHRFKELVAARGFTLVPLGGDVGYPMEAAFQQVTEQEFAGAIVWSYRGFLDEEAVQKSVRQVPTVALDHRIVGTQTDLVTFDHERAAYEATEQLIRQGCKRIGLTGMYDVLEITHQRFRGYMGAMFAHGLQADPIDFLFTYTSGSEGPAHTEILESRLRSGNRPDGFLVLQDIMMPPVVECALRAGLSLPQDLKLATLGDDLNLSVDGIGMTAVAFDWDSLAVQACDLLFERLNDLHRPAQERLASHHLVVRGLCGSGNVSPSPGPSDRNGYTYVTQWTRQQESP